jgi:hypothetical protein
VVNNSIRIGGHNYRIPMFLMVSIFRDKSKQKFDPKMAVASKELNLYFIRKSDLGWWETAPGRN